MCVYIYIHFTSKLRQPTVSARVSVFFLVPGFPDSGFLFSSPFSCPKNIESASQILLTTMRITVSPRVVGIICWLAFELPMSQSLSLYIILHAFASVIIFQSNIFPESRFSIRTLTTETLVLLR